MDSDVRLDAELEGHGSHDDDEDAGQDGEDGGLRGDGAGGPTRPRSLASSHHDNDCRSAQPALSGRRSNVSYAYPPPSRSPLLALPPELLTLAALHLATLPPNLGAPAPLLPLLRTCRTLYQRLRWGNWALWGGVGRAKFACSAASLPPWSSDEELEGGGAGTLKAAAYALKSHCLTLRTLRAGDVHAPDAGAALINAYWMLVGDAWPAAPLHSTDLPPLPEALRPLPAESTAAARERRRGTGKNRRQLAWAHARAFALRYVFVRLYEGRFGELDAQAGRRGRAWEWGRGAEWRVGWPRDTEAGAAALWVAWFFEGWDTLRAEPEHARRALMALLLPFVVVPFRYPSTLCPPHHYTVPLLPSVVRGMHDGEGAGAARRITVPTLHGRFPVYALGDPGEHGDVLEGKEESEADPGQWIIGEEGDSDRLQEDDHRLEDTARRSRRTSHPRPRHARPRSRRRSRSTARSPRSTRSASAPRPSPRHSRSSSARPSSRAYPASSSSPRSSSRSPRSPRVSSPPSSPAAWALSQDPHHQARALHPGRSRLLSAPPARLLFFARVQAGGRMGAPPFLARDRREAGERWVAGGGTGPQPVGPTQEDIHEKNARPVVRFEAQLPAYPAPAPPAAGVDSAAATSVPTASTSSVEAAQTGLSAAEVDAARAVPFVAADLDADVEMTDDGDQRWAAHAWRARLCTRYTAWAPVSREGSSSGESLAAGGGSVGNSSGGKKGEEGREEPARGGAPPGRIGRVYELGSFSGLWAGTMLMPSEPHYTALVTAPGGAFPPGGLERDDFIAAARPVYMRIAEHHSFHPHTPIPPPPPDSTTGEEGMRAGWLPHGARFLPRAVLHQAGHTQVEVRVDGAAAGNGSFEAQFGYAGVGGGYGAAFGAGGLEAGGGREDAYVYETVGERGRVREGAHAEGCPGCARAEERARWRRAGGDAEMREELSGRETSSGRRSDASYESQWQATSALASLQAASPSTSSSQGPSSSSQAPASLDKHSPSSQAPTSSQDPTSASQDTTSAASQSWPEWDAPVWAEHRFADDEGWEACDGVQDVVFTGATDPRHGMAWHHYEYAGRVRPWDGLIGLVMRPRDRTLGLATYFISGHLVGRNTFEGSWQMSAQDVLAPSWGGSICLARGEE